MTTPELLELIERDPSHVRTIDTLAYLAGVPRRSIEKAIQQARLEGVPVITDGGVRLAETPEDVQSLADWLAARLRTQRETVTALLATRDRLASEAVRKARTAQQTLGLAEALA